MKPVKAYQTSDGTLFETEVQASRHEEFLKHSDVIEQFLDSDLNTYRSGPQRVIAKNSIINWQLWNAKNAK